MRGKDQFVLQDSLIWKIKIRQSEYKILPLMSLVAVEKLVSNLNRTLIQLRGVTLWAIEKIRS